MAKKLIDIAPDKLKNSDNKVVDKKPKKRAPKGTGEFVKNKDGTITNKLRYTKNGKSDIMRFRGVNKTEAAKLRDEWKRKQEFGIIDIANKTTLIDYLRKWIVTYKQNSVAECTYDSIEDCINCRVALYAIADMQLLHLNMDVMQVYINELVAAEYSLGTIKKTYNTLNNCFKKAVTKKDLATNPLVGVELPSEKKVIKKQTKIKFYPPDDMQRILNEVKRTETNGKSKYRYGYLIVLMMFTGIRVGECLGLRWENIDIDNKRIFIRTSITRVKNRNNDDLKKRLQKESDLKTPSSKRTIPLHDNAIYALNQIAVLNQGHTEPKDYISLTSEYKLTNQSNINRTLKHIEDNANTSVKGCRVHCLRHTFASYLIYNKKDIITISKLLGHAKPSVTMDVYIDIIEEQKTDAINVFDNIY